jgi:O-antigen ligase
MRYNPDDGSKSGNDLVRFRYPGAKWRFLRADVTTRLTGIVFPFGLFALLTGLFWIGDHGNYSKLFYWLVVLPTLLLIVVCPENVSALLKSRIFLAYLSFACYMGATVLWSGGEDNAMDLVKRPLYVLLLFLALFGFGRQRFHLLATSVKWSAAFALLVAAYSVVSFFIAGGSGRFSGYGALRNPLLVSHVFGFFLALWGGLYFCERKLIEPYSLSAVLVLMAVLVATGSRTPLVAAVFTTVWLSVLSADRKGVIATSALAALGVLVWLYFPEVITQRGLSYRTEIWADVWRQISERLWLGHGFGTPLAVWVEDLRTTFSDPHNLTLSVLYAGGLVGGGLWLFLYGVALKEAWHGRRDKWVLAFSATVVYGFAAGLTEGGSFLSRPKEHWFLIWIPLALLAAAVFKANADEQANRNGL